MTVATESVVALPNGSPVQGVDSPPARRTRTRARVVVTPRSVNTKAVAARGRRAFRSALEVVYLDAADSWMLTDSTPSIRQVWAADYAASVPGDYRPFRWWCKGYRIFAVGSAAVLDGAKWCLIHPVRGPLLIAATGAGVSAMVWG